MRVPILLALASASLFASCVKDDTPPPAPKKEIKNSVTMDLTNYVGDQELAISTGIYTNQDGDNFRVNKFIYFISNVKLKNADGSEYAHPGTFRVSETDEESLSIEMENIPDGTYKSVSFMIGIDSIANKYAVSSGQSSSNDEMYLNESAGYMMVNMEGMSPASHQPDNKLVFHIGGSVAKPLSFTFPHELTVNNNFKHIRLKTDLLMLFGPDYVVDFSMLSAVYWPGDNANVIANNYRRMITLSGVGD